MKSEWKEATLGEVASFGAGWRNSQDAVVDGNFPFFTCAREVLRHAEFDFDSEAIIMAGNNADARFHLHYFHGKFAARQRTYVITPASKQINCRYLYYALHAMQPFFSAQAQGTTTKFVTIGILRNAPISLPSLPEQESIASILGGLDDRIELNCRMNDTLGAMARALFQSWFMDFDPVRAKLDDQGRLGLDKATAALFPSAFQESRIGNIPECWTVELIGQVVDCVGGGTPSTTRSEYWEGGIHHWATPKDLSSLQAPILFNTDRKLTEAGVDKVSSGLLPAGTLLMSSRAPVGYLAIAAMPIAINQGFIALKCNDRASNYFMLNWCQANMTEIEGRATGTTFAEISKQNFRSIPVVLPPKELMEAFTARVAPLYAKIHANLLQSRTLTVLRDTLLPKLVSGELSVANLQDTKELLDA